MPLHDDENDMSPWDIAASSPPATATFGRSRLPAQSNESRVSSHYFCCSLRGIQKTLQLWICIDVILTVGLFTCVWLEPRRHRSFDWVAGITAVLLGLRSLWSCCGFSTDWVCERSTLLWSARISWILIVVAAGGAILLLTVAHAPPPVHNSTERLALQVWLWMIAGIELIRFFLLRHYYKFQVQRDRDDLQRSSFESEAFRRRPWWWEEHENISRHNLREPFLPDGLEWTLDAPSNSFLTSRQTHNVEPTTSVASSSWWDSVFFWKFRGNDRDDHNDLRDEGSVDFASVQDEWASRSEQDPYWWSRDETLDDVEEQQQQGKKKSSTLPTWIHTPSFSELKLQRNYSNSSNDE